MENKEKVESKNSHGANDVILIKEVEKFIDEFKNESDRAVVIIGAAKIDNLLMELLLNKLMPNVSGNDELFDGDSPLSTFSAKINLCYRIGIIDAELTRALHIIRRIRNSFAHEVSGCSLDSGQQKDRIHQLIAPLIKYEKFHQLKEYFFKDKMEYKINFHAIIALISARLQYALYRIERVDESKKISFIPSVYKETTVKKNEK